MGLQDSERMSTIGLRVAVLAQYKSVTDRQTDGPTPCYISVAYAFMDECRSAIKIA